MRSSSEVLEGNKVKLSVEVDEEELEGAVNETVRRLQREVRVPGFRPGKVPRRLLEARLGTKAIREEVIRHSLPDYYAQAVEEQQLDTIAAPEIDITAGEEDGPFAFDAVVEVRPKVSVAGYEGLQVELPAPVASDEEVQKRLDALRENFAELREVGRPVQEGDVVTIDITASRHGEPVDDLSMTDYVYEIGTGMVAPGVDEALAATKVGDIVEVDAEEASGGTLSLKVLVKLVREKVLPEATDEWASEASEFDTLAELEADVRNHLDMVRKMQANFVLREGAVAELAKLVEGEMPETLVDQELARLQEAFLRRLAEQKATLEEYLAATGQDEAALVADLRAQAVEDVRADLAKRALADALEIEVSEDDMAEEISAYAASLGRPVERVARQFAESGALERLRSEIRNAKAVAWLVEHVAVVDEQGNPMDRALLGERQAPADSEAASGEPAEAGPAPDGDSEEDEV